MCEWTRYSKLIHCNVNKRRLKMKKKNQNEMFLAVKMALTVISYNGTKN